LQFIRAAVPVFLPLYAPRHLISRGWQLRRNGWKYAAFPARRAGASRDWEV